MSKTTIDRLIINSPYEEPGQYWSYDRESRLFDRKEGRRPAGYVIASESSKAFDDPGIFIEIPLVNEIRRRVKTWREHPTLPYAGVTGITRRLLDHWNKAEKREFLEEWIRAVNNHAGFGQWAWAVSKNHADLKGILRTYSDGKR
jgi:type III restriction enzyme